MPEIDSIIIFDLDGTLVDSRKDLTKAVNLMRKDYDLRTLSCKELTALIGDGNIKLVERAISGADIPLSNALQKFSNYYRSHIVDETELYPEAITSLIEIKKMGYKLALVTNKNREFTDIICDRLGIIDFFDIIIGGGDVKELKPHPEGILKVLKTTRSTPKSSWMVGDSHTDIAAASRAGINSCLCAFGPGNPENEIFTISVYSLQEFVTCLKDLKHLT